MRLCCRATGPRCGTLRRLRAERDQTRREHVLEIETALGLRPLTRVLYRELAAWLLPTALATDHGPTLVTTLLEETARASHRLPIAAGHRTASGLGSSPRGRK